MNQVPDRKYRAAGPRYAAGVLLQGGKRGSNQDHAEQTADVDTPAPARSPAARRFLQHEAPPDWRWHDRGPERYGAAVVNASAAAKLQ